MFQGAIVDDETDVLDFIQSEIKNEFKKRNSNIAIEKFNNGQSLLNMLSEHYHYDFIFLDIEMPQMNGIELCRNIKLMLPNCLVIFISNKDELVFQTFEVQPFRFIRKNHFKDQLPILVESLLYQISKQKKTVIQITESGSKDIFSFDISKIQYIESNRKQCLIVTDLNKTYVTFKLADFEKCLDTYEFIKPHRSYLVNCQSIFHISKTSIKLTNGIDIPVSRDRLESVKQQFLIYSKK